MLVGGSRFGLGPRDAERASLIVNSNRPFSALG